MASGGLCVWGPWSSAVCGRSQLNVVLPLLVVVVHAGLYGRRRVCVFRREDDCAVRVLGVGAAQAGRLGGAPLVRAEGGAGVEDAELLRELRADFQ